ncbi:hypothetical protein UVI_02028070 [Ustilaginoidea virens]|uniref:Uncharacterized protein n=1 Tax=Ustilaginoidea virens TaxID=1159556 RepID=A0A1B5KVD7_USTVR|nr:hypothetical protein UVI_02028070 [Ustilaginoidea virens]
MTKKVDAASIAIPLVDRAELASILKQCLRSKTASRPAEYETISGGGARARALIVTLVATSREVTSQRILLTLSNLPGPDCSCRRGASAGGGHCPKRPLEWQTMRGTGWLGQPRGENPSGICSKEKDV